MNQQISISTPNHTLYPQARHHTVSPVATYGLLLGLGLFLLSSCTPSLQIRHRSQVKRAIHVYINWDLKCRVAPGETCRLDLEPGRYFFHALVPNMPQYRWSSPENPVPFSVDKETVIDLHDPKTARPPGAPASYSPSRPNGQR